MSKHKECCCISHHFFRSASDHPNNIALLQPSSSHVRSFTYSHLLASVNSFASRLSSLSSTTPTLFAIYIPPSPEYVAAVLAVLRCGHAFLPLDPSWPNHRLLSAINSSNVDLVITTSSADWLLRSTQLRVLCFSMDQEQEQSFEFPWPCQRDKQSFFSYVMFTSGSTGQPKGVCGTEQGLLNRFLWMQELYPLKGDENLLFKTSISFIDHLQEFLSAILTGCTLIIPPFAELNQNLFSIVDYIQAYSIDRLTAVPSMMRTILPALESLYEMHVQSSLKLLVLSGEILPLSLWATLSKVLPGTSILNLYGSTEVSGDCTYFDCKRLPMILESERLTSVPIGIPIANCDVVLGEDDIPNQGEIYVSGTCNSVGYYSNAEFVTGDFAKRLQGGDLVFLGRKDRTIKLNGQRIALEEIENALRGHPNVADAVVISCKVQEETMLLVAFIILKKERTIEICRSHIKSWMVDSLPSAMIPSHIIFTEAFPMSSTGKVGYELLASEFLAKHVQDKDNICDFGNSNLLQVINKAFCDALMVQVVSDDDDFFKMGGNSIAAAHLSNNLGVDMRLLYYFPSPSKLCTALLERNKSSDLDLRKDGIWEMNSEQGKGNVLPTPNIKLGLRLLRTPHEKNENHAVVSKRLKLDLDSKVNVDSKGLGPVNSYPWNTASICLSCSFSRGNKVMYGGEGRVTDIDQETCIEVPRSRKVAMQELWKVYMGSCVDASPLVVLKGPDIYLFVGSHSHEFLCVNARSGSVQWRIQLEGRIECSAAILGDFSMVKSQPVVDVQRQLIWCGSHDHNLYALDYINQCCVYKVPCGGSIFGSPAIDEVNNKLYVASTSGRMTAISLKALPFDILWVNELEVPVFGSLAVCSLTGNIICCLVDGHVLALDSRGSTIWKYKISGPLFAGACICSALPFQVLICSRDGSIYSFETEKGYILWEYNVGDPITASAYVDEFLCLKSDPSLSSDRLVCVCSSSGSIILIRVKLDKKSKEANVEEFAKLEVEGDVFSSPVMVGGRIFVGCRDDYLHCISLTL
ncbi:hypothetical protein UlMin_004871 [Ulmus minor]